MKIWTIIASKSRLQRKRGAEGTRAMSTQRFMWNYGTSKKPKGLEARYHQILDGTHLYGKFSEGHEAWTFDEVV